MSAFSSRNPSPTRDRGFGATTSSLAHALAFSVPTIASSTTEDPRMNADLSAISQYAPLIPPSHLMASDLAQTQFSFSIPSVPDHQSSNHTSSEIPLLFKSIALAASAAEEAVLSGRSAQAELLQIQASLAALTAINASSVQSQSVYATNGGHHNTAGYVNGFGLDVPLMYETADMSRKRCASSVAGPAVMKTMKLENGTFDHPINLSHTPLSLLSTPYTPIDNLSQPAQDNIFISPLPSSTLASFQQHRITSLPSSPIERPHWLDPLKPQRRHQHSASVDSICLPTFATGPNFEASGDMSQTPVASPVFEQLYDGNLPKPDKRTRGRPLQLRSFQQTNGSVSQVLSSALDSMNFPSYQHTPLDLSPTSPNDIGDYSFDSADGALDDSDPGNESDHQRHGRSLSRGDELPIAQRDTLERVFLEFLNKICSNLEAKDSKGELIHQTLMAKKMQRLDESSDFRPFKFRIAALTNAFTEELEAQGWGNIPVKKARFFLWNSPLICRYTDEGRKCKSKGNHVWSVDAKKSDEGWIFRPFPRRIVGAPDIAQAGTIWTFTPRIWDPQLGRPNAIVTYSSPSLPHWLSWRDGRLSGVPPSNTHKIDVVVDARFDVGGTPNHLSETYSVPVMPMSLSEPAIPPPTGMSNSTTAFHRTVSDSVLQTTPSVTRPIVPQQSDNQSDFQVVQVLNAAARNIAQAHSHIATAASLPDDNDAGLRSLEHQQRILTTVARALQPIETEEAVESPLASVGRSVVYQAARQAETDRKAVFGSSIARTVPVTVNDVTVKTQDIVAQAVEMHKIKPESSNLEVMMTASSLLHQQTHISSDLPFV